MQQLINADCMEYVRQLPSNSVDCLILDPHFDKWENFYDFPLDVLKEDGVLIAFSNRPHTGRLQVRLDEKLKFLTEVVWNFSDGARWVSHKLPLMCHENILIYTKAKKNPLNDMRLLEWIDKPKQTKKGASCIGKWRCADRVYTPQEFGQVESVMYFSRSTRKDIGIIAKPYELCKLLLQMCSKEGGTVLDPFMGSGIFGYVCKELNRDYIGIEIDKHTFDEAKKLVEGVIL